MRHSTAFNLLSTFVAPLALALAPLSAAEIPGSSDVLARRGTSEITESEVDARMREVPEQQRAGFIDSAERIDSMLNQMLLIEQMAAEARKLGLDKTEEFEQERKLAENRALSITFQEHLFKNAPKFEAEVLAQEAYAASPKDFVIGDSIDVRHVLIKTECRSPQAAKKLAEEIRERALKGESVADLARKYSEDDGSAAEGGLFRNVGRGKMVKPFEEAAFAMTNAGELSPVVETSHGYHVIEMVEHRAGRPAKFEEIREGLIAQMEQRHKARYLKDRSDRLFNLPLEGNPERLQALRTRYGDAGVAPSSDAVPAPMPVLGTKQ